MADYKDEIRSQIVLKEHHWQNIYTTNCYAFALGLDVPGNRHDYHFQLGDFYCNITGAKYSEVKENYTRLDRLKMDLDALELEPEEADPEEQTIINITYDENGNEIVDYSWLIAYFYSSQRGDYHFLRKAPNGVWWHKQGFDGVPNCHDGIWFNVIRDITSKPLFFHDKYIKTYRLRLRKERK